MMDCPDISSSGQSDGSSEAHDFTKSSMGMQALDLVDDEGLFVLHPELCGDKIHHHNFTDGTTEDAVVRRVVQRIGLRESEEDEDWNLYWTDLSVSFDRVIAMKPWQKINHFPGMSEICRKDSLAKNLNRMLKKFPEDYAIFPKTWCLPPDLGEFQNYARKYKSQVYIVKPDTGCQGKGIFITKCWKDIGPLDSSICQVYLSKPFLINGYKFDIRLYVLLTSCDPLRVFVFKDGLVRFTTIPYAKPSQRNLNNMYMHLTNYAVQKHSLDYVRDDEEGGTKRRITTLNRWFVRNGFDVKKLWLDIDDIVIKTILSGYPVLRHNYRTCFPNHMKTSACFEILGFDVMLDCNLKPYVLEVNHSPSFSTDSRLDKEIKETVLWDTLNLINLSALCKKKAIDDERKRIQDRMIRSIHRQSAKLANDEVIKKYLAVSEKYELDHKGNFRRIYPPSGCNDYEKFINLNSAFFHETTTYKARTEHARQLREEIRLKKEKLDEILNRSKTSLPESPTKNNQVGAVATNRLKGLLPKIKLSRKKQQGIREDEVKESWRPRPIRRLDELERREGLRAREMYMRKIGLIDAIRWLLADTPGVVPPSVANSSKKEVVRKSVINFEFVDTRFGLASEQSIHPVNPPVLHPVDKKINMIRKDKGKSVQHDRVVLPVSNIDWEVICSKPIFTHHRALVSRPALPTHLREEGGST